MDNQNSRVRSSRLCSTQAILHNMFKLKTDIQNQVYELIDALKKRERELCMQVDRQCLEQLCEAEECDADYEPLIGDWLPDEEDPNENGYTQGKVISTRVEFHSEFMHCKNLLQNYGCMEKLNCSNKTAHKSQIDKNQLPKDQTGMSRHENKGFAESFDFFCCSSDEEFNEMTRTFKLIPADKIMEDPVVEKASCCSVDSFEIIQDGFCVINDLASDTAQTKLPSTSVINPDSPTCCNNKNSSYPTFYLPNLQKREHKEGDWLAPIVGHLPKEKSAVKEPSKEVVVDAKVLPTTYEKHFTGQRVGDKSAAKEPAKEVAADAKVLPTTSENQSTVQQDGGKPANALQASFRAYLQNKDPKIWIHPKRVSDESSYEQWVAKNTSPCISEGGISDAVINAFTRQLKSFVM